MNEDQHPQAGSSTEFRQLSEAELCSVYNALAGHFQDNTGLASDIEKHVRLFYPESACSAVLNINSEYNDSTYDNRIKCLVAYDRDGKEVAPVPSTAEACRSQWDSFSIQHETYGELHDIFVYLATQPLPQLYVKS